jgi:hypothetical protein
MEERDSTLAERRNASASREMKLEQDAEFKTNFLRIVIDCLKDLQWPPALEAFNDPLESLVNDKDTIHSAIAYMIRNALPQDITRHTRASASNDHTRSPKGSVNGTEHRVLSELVSGIDRCHHHPNAAT